MGHYQTIFYFSGSYLSDGEVINPLILNEFELLQKTKKFLHALTKKHGMNFQGKGLKIGLIFIENSIFEPKERYFLDHFYNFCYSVSSVSVDS